MNLNEEFRQIFICVERRHYYASPILSVIKFIFF